MFSIKYDENITVSLSIIRPSNTNKIKLVIHDYFEYDDLIAHFYTWGAFYSYVWHTLPDDQQFWTWMLREVLPEYKKHVGDAFKSLDLSSLPISEQWAYQL